MREIPFQRHKHFKNREEATACPQTHTERNARLQAKIILKSACPEPAAPPGFYWRGGLTNL